MNVKAVVKKEKKGNFFGETKGMQYSQRLQRWFMPGRIR